MILTLTPNPSLDLLFTAGRLAWDDANRVPMPRRRPGGQGINVVRAARALEPAASAVAIAPLGGAAGRELAAMLGDEGTPLRAVPIDGETRLFVGARERDTGRSLLLNPHGPGAGDDMAERLLGAVGEALLSGASVGGRNTWVGCCGSLLPGLPTELYAEVGRLAHDHDARFVPDCDGESLARAAEAADLLVPNDMEASRLVGRPVHDPAGAAEAGRVLLERGCDRVAITLGDRGAVLVTSAGAWWAAPRLPGGLADAARQGSAVGAGDAFLAALLLGLQRQAGAGSSAQGEAEPALLREAVATGTAALLSRGSALVRPEDVERVRPHVRVDDLRG